MAASNQVNLGCDSARVPWTKRSPEGQKGQPYRAGFTGEHVIHPTIGLPCLNPNESLQEASTTVKLRTARRQSRGEVLGTARESRC